MVNKKIKAFMFNESIPQWRVAKALGVSESTLTRRLRAELPEEEQNRIIEVMKKECVGNDD